MCRETMVSPKPGQQDLQDRQQVLQNQNVVNTQTLASEDSERMEASQQQLMELDLNLPLPPSGNPIMERPPPSPTLPIRMDVANSFEKAAAIERNLQRIIKKRVSAVRSRERKKAFDILFPVNSTKGPKEQSVPVQLHSEAGITVNCIILF